MDKYNYLINELENKYPSYNFQIKEINKELYEDNQIDKVVFTTTLIEDVLCRYCNSCDNYVKTKGTRIIRDVSINNVAIELIIPNNTYFCKNKECEHKFFNLTTPIAPDRRSFSHNVYNIIAENLNLSALEISYKLLNGYKVKMSHDQVLDYVKKIRDTKERKHMF